MCQVENNVNHATREHRMLSVDVQYVHCAVCVHCVQCRADPPHMPNRKILLAVVLTVSATAATAITLAAADGVVVVVVAITAKCITVRCFCSGVFMQEQKNLSLFGLQRSKYLAR